MMNGDSSTYVVKAERLTKKFGAFTAVDEISLAVARGEIFGFLGANGAGKTTAIRMFCGLLKPTAGDSWVAGVSVRGDARELRRRIGYMSQKFSLYEDLTVAQNVELYGGIYNLPRSEIAQRMAELLSRVGLNEERRRLVRDLPLGFKQRLALGCALLHKPEVMFLDEPTSGVDPAMRRVFWDIIYDIADRGATVFVTTHYMDEAEYCRRVSVMAAGSIIALAAPSQLKKETGAATMQDAFLTLVRTAAERRVR